MEPATESDGDLKGTEAVLVVEAEKSIRRLTRKILESYGYTVIDAPDGHEACRMAAAFPKPIDLLMTDLVMPQMGGFEVAARIRSARPEIQVLYTSGYTEAFVKQNEDREALSEAFVEKPFTRSVLGRRVREALSR